MSTGPGVDAKEMASCQHQHLVVCKASKPATHKTNEGNMCPKFYLPTQVKGDPTRGAQV